MSVNTTDNNVSHVIEALNSAGIEVDTSSEYSCIPSEEIKGLTKNLKTIGDILGKELHKLPTLISKELLTNLKPSITFSNKAPKSKPTSGRGL